MTDRMPYLANAACRGLKPTTVLCGTCWDRPECLAWALEHEDTGIWGGHTPTGLNRLRAEFGIRLDTIYASASGYAVRGTSR